MTRAGRNSGYALAGTMVFLVLALLIWMAVFRQTSSYLRTEKAMRTRTERQLGCTKALAWGLTLLETGKLPTNPYSCRVVVSLSPQQTYVLTFTRLLLRKRVAVRPATPSDASLPLAPANFN